MRVATPSSRLNSLTNEISKSFISKDNFLLFLLAYNSWACSNIISFFVPLSARFPSRSNFLSEFFLTQESIKQLPGPKSLLLNEERLFFSLIIVIFDIPPIFRKQTGNLILFLNK